MADPLRPDSSDPPPTDHDPATAARPVLNYVAQRSGKLVVVARFTDYLESELARNKLEAEGIRCMVGGMEVTAGLGTYVPTRGTQISVYEQDADRARAVL